MDQSIGIERERERRKGRKNKKRKKEKKNEKKDRIALALMKFSLFAIATANHNQSAARLQPAFIINRLRQKSQAEEQRDNNDDRHDVSTILRVMTSNEKERDRNREHDIMEHTSGGDTSSTLTEIRLSAKGKRSFSSDSSMDEHLANGECVKLCMKITRYELFCRSYLFHSARNKNNRGYKRGREKERGKEQRRSPRCSSLISARKYQRPREILAGSS